MEEIKIVVATHKKYEMPFSDMYLPVHVGAVYGGELGYQKDNEGQNISEKNPNYCELTGHYWAWKNVNAHYVGLVHYRRHFRNSSRRFKNKFDNIISEEKVKKLLTKTDVILPKKRHYYIETNKGQYIHAHHKEGFIITEEIIKTYYPDYMQAFQKMLHMRSGHRFNMFIMRYDIFNSYSEWLFDVLFKVEEQLDIKNWDTQEQRVFGYLSERLLDVWLIKNKIKYKDVSYIFMEKQNWSKKIFNFLKRKLKNKR
ncbi:MAG TPA: exopolysaccharide biosynthesis protein [Clostridiales bacterium]|nr:exopolysaccharide biosynthesis protein [Clostridiales bacterium]